MLFGHAQQVWALLWKTAQQGGYRHNNLHNFIQSSSPKFSFEAKYQFSLKLWLALRNLAFKGSLANIPPCPSYFLSLLPPWIISSLTVTWQVEHLVWVLLLSVSRGESFRVNASVLAWWLWRVKRTLKGRTTAMNSCLIFQGAMFSVTYLITPFLIRSLM